MAEICCGLMNDQSEGSSVCETTSSRAARKRRMDLRKIKFSVGQTGDNNTVEENVAKKPRMEVNYNYPVAGGFSRDCDYAVENCGGGDYHQQRLNGSEVTKEMVRVKELKHKPPLISSELVVDLEGFPKFGMSSVCGRRRDMEDAVAIHPSFCRGGEHYFAVYDGHGCSHVATKCRERMHVLVKEELENESIMEWKDAMERSFNRMDKEAVTFNASLITASCRCELQSPECDAVGSAAVVAVMTPDKIIVANCGDSRAVLCRNGKTIPLSADHKPDRPDELDRIQAAGGRVISWDCPRVEGVLAMSRAIGDNYLKPFVSCEPEVTITDRTAEDDCLILASDGLWDVVSNETACGVARMCLKGKVPAAPPPFSGHGADQVLGNENSDKACSDASMLLTKLALARRSADNVSVIVIDLRMVQTVDTEL